MNMRLLAAALLASAHAFVVPGGSRWLGAAPAQQQQLSSPSRHAAPVCAVTERTAIASDMCVHHTASAPRRPTLWRLRPLAP